MYKKNLPTLLFGPYTFIKYFLKNPTYTIIWPYTFINLPTNYHPTRLFRPTLILGTQEYVSDMKELEFS